MRAPRGAMPLLVAAAATVFTGCAHRPGPGVPAGSAPAGNLAAVADPGIDYRDPARVCQGFAAALYRRDTTSDRGPTGAYRRAAAAYGSVELIAAVAGQPDGRDPDWGQWAAHRAVADPTASGLSVGDGQPADTSVDAYRAAVVTVTPIGRDGWRGPTARTTVYCTLRASDGRWRVAGYNLGAAPPAEATP